MGQTLHISRQTKPDRLAFLSLEALVSYSLNTVRQIPTIPVDLAMYCTMARGVVNRAASQRPSSHQ